MKHTIIVLCLSVMGIIGSASASDRPPDNRLLSRDAYSALQADEELADLNLGVRVDQPGVVTIWGPVPTERLRRKAERAIESIKGIKGIINECELTTPDDQFLKEVTDALKGKKSTLETPVVAAPPLPPVSLPLDERQTVVSLKPKKDVVVTGSQPPVGAPMARLLEPHFAGPSETDHRAIQRLRSSDRRFADLRLELRDGRIVISGMADNPAIAWELANQIAPYAGSRKVVVGSVTRR